MKSTLRALLSSTTAVGLLLALAPAAAAAEPVSPQLAYRIENIVNTSSNASDRNVNNGCLYLERGLNTIKTSGTPLPSKPLCEASYRRWKFIKQGNNTYKIANVDAEGNLCMSLLLDNKTVSGQSCDTKSTNIANVWSLDELPGRWQGGKQVEVDMYRLVPQPAQCLRVNGEVAEIQECGLTDKSKRNYSNVTLNQRFVFKKADKP